MRRKAKQRSAARARGWSRACERSDLRGGSGSAESFRRAEIPLGRAAGAGADAAISAAREVMSRAICA